MQLNSLFKHWSYRIIAPGTLLRERYEALKRLLQFDIRSHEEMAELQDLLHDGHREDFARIRRRFGIFSKQVTGMIDSLDTMDPGTYSSLKAYHKKFDFYTRFLLAPPAIKFEPPYTIPLAQITLENDLVGNKAKHLAMLQASLDIPVPKGFAVSSAGFHYFIEYNGLRDVINNELVAIDIYDPNGLKEISDRLVNIVQHSDLPPEIEKEMRAGVAPWGQKSGVDLKIAVRSSAISEDGECSFAGQYSTVLNVSTDDIGKAYLDVIASKYSPEALFYRISQGLGDEETAMSVLIQEMVQARCSGVLYTEGVDGNEANNRDLHLHITPGLGEGLVSGTVNPDYYIIKRPVPAKLTKVVDNGFITDKEVIQLATLGLRIEGYFDEAQDIEWAIDTEGKFFILQARELHVSEEVAEISVPENLEEMLLLKGCEKAARGISSGAIHILKSTRELDNVPKGCVLVTHDSPPDLVRVMNRISAVISERGSRASHFATVAREFGIPFLTGVENARTLLEDSTTVTVDGNNGTVYSGQIDPLLEQVVKPTRKSPYYRVLKEALKFITPLELVDPTGDNFTPEGCRSMHDIIRFCHEKALYSMFSTGKPGTGRGALRLDGDIPLDVFLFDVGGGIDVSKKDASIPLGSVNSIPFKALWKGLSHPDVQWKQKPFDWDAYDKIELAGGVPPKKDSFAFASYAVVGRDYLHFNLRFGYHFTIVDVMCSENSAENHCMLRFAGGGGDYEHLSLRINFLTGVLERQGFHVEKRGDLLEAKLAKLDKDILTGKLDMLGRLLGASKLMDMVLDGDEMVASCVEDFYNGRYSFSQEG
jgi:pyruvate,water dikinase